MNVQGQWYLPYLPNPAAAAAAAGGGATAMTHQTGHQLGPAMMTGQPQQHQQLQMTADNSKYLATLTHQPHQQQQQQHAALLGLNQSNLAALAAAGNGYVNPHLFNANFAALAGLQAQGLFGPAAGGNALAMLASTGLAGHGLQAQGLGCLLQQPQQHQPQQQQQQLVSVAATPTVSLGSNSIYSKLPLLKTPSVLKVRTGIMMFAYQFCRHVVFDIFAQNESGFGTVKQFLVVNIDSGRACGLSDKQTRRRRSERSLVLFFGLTTIAKRQDEVLRHTHKACFSCVNLLTRESHSVIKWLLPNF